MISKEDLYTIDDAARIVGKLPHNIRYYIQYKRINKFNTHGEVIDKANNGELRVSLTELKKFISLLYQGLDKHHTADLSHELGFYDLPEYKRTKHVHRLHPYLGKFIPQLVESFLSKYFRKGQMILDPFMGSGTTLVQACEMGINSIGIDISPFNCLIAKAKTDNYNIELLNYEVLNIRDRTQTFSNYKFNDETNDLFSSSKIYDSKIVKNSIISDSDYLNSWFAPRALEEMLYYRDLISEYVNRDLLKVLLSRAVRSSRLISHNDLAYPKSPLEAGKPYWCEKHNKYCVPIGQCMSKIHMYSEDTVRRVVEYSKLRSKSEIYIIQDDSRTADLSNILGSGRLLDGVFTSPPYVGQIDYHDQHQYAYELFGLNRFDECEIGPKKKGKSKQSQTDYINGIADVLKNASRYLKRMGLVFIVANDRLNLYPKIAEIAELEIIDEIKRAVTKRTEKGNDPYQESIFVMVKM